MTQTETNIQIGFKKGMTITMEALDELFALLKK